VDLDQEEDFDDLYSKDIEVRVDLYKEDETVFDEQVFKNQKHLYE
jgi:hypothetical protein